MPERIPPYEGSDPYIFVGYSHKDSDKILPILNAMIQDGYRVWYDEGIPWTSEWPEVIEDHLFRCSMCLVFHSSASVESVYCRREIHYALKENKPILSVYLEKIRLKHGLDMQLSPYQSVYLTRKGQTETFLRDLKKQPNFEICRTPPETETDKKSTDSKKHDVFGIILEIFVAILSFIWIGYFGWEYLNQPRITWTLDNGVLTIRRGLSLSTAIPDYVYAHSDDGRNFHLNEDPKSRVPWYSQYENITSVVIQSGITYIGNSAFEGCYSLTDITIPNSVTSIGEGAFRYCRSLSSVDIPNSVTSIGEDAFKGCDSLTDIDIPDGVTTIGDYAFAYCRSLSSVTIPDGVTSISDSSFRNCKSLSSVTIPNSITKIGNYAFCECTSLSSVTIPNSVWWIGDSAFFNCTNLSSVDIPNSVYRINSLAFRKCALTSVVIPESTEVEEAAFDEDVQIIRR